jgi:hypothetical protein
MKILLTWEGQMWEKDRSKAVGKTLTGLWGDGRDGIALVFGDGTHLKGIPQGDCCSVSWIEHIEGATGLRPGKIVSIEKIDMPDRGDYDANNYDVLSFYGERIVLDSATEIVIDFRNDSNGYYGGGISWSLKDGALPLGWKSVDEDF